MLCNCGSDIRPDRNGFCQNCGVYCECGSGKLMDRGGYCVDCAPVPIYSRMGRPKSRFQELVEIIETFDRCNSFRDGSPDNYNLVKKIKELTGSGKWNLHSKAYVVIGQDRGVLFNNNRYFVKLLKGKELLIINNGHYEILRVKDSGYDETLLLLDDRPLYVQECIKVGGDRINIQSHFPTKSDIIPEFESCRG